MSEWVQRFFFGIYPYICVTVLLLGSWLRFEREQFRLDRRAEGRPLPWEAARRLARERLLDQAWRAAAASFVRGLAGAADIEGCDLAGPDPEACDEEGRP